MELTRVKLGVIGSGVQWLRGARGFLLLVSTGISLRHIYIDELIFQQKRYGFNPEQARTDMKAVNAALIM